MKRRIRTTHFFLEMIVATILSLVSASLWTDLLRKIISENYANNTTTLLIICIFITVFAILVLKHLFAEIPENYEGYIRDNNIDHT